MSLHRQPDWRMEAEGWGGRTWRAQTKSIQPWFPGHGGKTLVPKTFCYPTQFHQKEDNFFSTKQCFPLKMGCSEPSSNKNEGEFNLVLIFLDSSAMWQEGRGISLEERAMRQVGTVATSQDQLPEGILHEVVGIMVASGVFGQVTGQDEAI